ncbi:MAG TPA: hypothetical protein VMB18_02005 [Terriglobales bacterium]|nr:hypothetical protein [Terriglobales bacterium]
MRGDPINSSISLPGGSGVAARILFRVCFGLVSRLAGHGDRVTQAAKRVQDSEVSTGLKVSMLERFKVSMLEGFKVPQRRLQGRNIEILAP